MGMVGDTETLQRNAELLRQEVLAWWKCKDKWTRKLIEMRVEYYLKQVADWHGYALEEWRTVFKKRPSVKKMHAAMKRLESGR